MNGKAFIRELELFSEVEDGGLGPVDESVLKDIAAVANAKMVAGQHPQIVINHARPGEPIQHECVGRVCSKVKLAKHAKSGKLVLVADVEMPQAAFDQYIRSNAFPRRSAEIQKDGLWMAQVSLLGRRAPGADIPDTHFDAGRGMACYSTSEMTNTEFAMTTDELMAAFDGMTDDDRADFMCKYRAKYETAPGPTSTYVPGVIAPDKPKDEDMADHETAEKLATFAAELGTVKAANDTLKSENAELGRQIKALQLRPRLDELKRRGFKVDPDRELGILMTFDSADKIEAHFAFIQDTYKQVVTAASLTAPGVVGPVAAPEGAAPQITPDVYKKVADYATSKGQFVSLVDQLALYDKDHGTSYGNAYKKAHA